MKTVTVSLELDDILRERLDACTTYKRDIKIPKEILEALKSGKELTDDEFKHI